MGLKQKRGTIVLEALEIKYIRYAVLSLPTHTTKKSRSFLKYFRKQSAQQPEMPKDSKMVEIMANKKGNGRNTRYREVKMREDSKVDLCLVSETTAQKLLEDGKPEPCGPITVVLSDGKTYQCVARFEARWCEKANPESDKITLYVAQGINDMAIFPKNKRLSKSGSTIAPIEGKPRTAEEKKLDAERDKAAQAAKVAAVQENRDRKKDAFTNTTKKP